MDWTDGCERYLAAHYGESIDDPRTERAEEVPRCSSCGHIVPPEGVFLADPEPPANARCADTACVVD